MLIPIGFFGAGASAASYELISTQIMTTNTPIVYFNSIPATFKHLQLRISVRSSATGVSDLFSFRFNNDSGANYAIHNLKVIGTSVSSAGSASLTEGWLGNSAGNSTGSDTFAGGVIDILDYAMSKNKTVRSMMGYTHTTNPRVELTSSLWASTAVVNSIMLFNQSGASATGTRLSLYGIKG